MSAVPTLAPYDTASYVRTYNTDGLPSERTPISFIFRARLTLISSARRAITPIQLGPIIRVVMGRLPANAG